jgi:hypothetical protein
MRKTKQRKARPVILRKLREVIRGAVRDVVDARRAGEIDHYPPASISAQLRHLRKPQNGARTVVKRCRTLHKAMRAEDFGAVWEYSMLQERRVAVRRVRRIRRKAGMVLQAASG